MMVHCSKSMFEDLFSFLRIIENMQCVVGNGDINGSIEVIVGLRKS